MRRRARTSSTRRQRFASILFDFPIPAAKLAERATRTKIRTHVFDIASEQDLLHLKRIAKAARSVPGDAEDIAFLESRRKRSR